MRLIIALSLALTACTTIEDDTACEGGKCDVDQSCDDPHYGDGTCQTSLACGVPDIDCFKTFDSDTDASAWFGEFETKLAMEEGRQPRKMLPETDPKFQKARELLDRGWEVFRTHRAVGLLGDKRPALVVLEDPVNNAFVAPDLATDTSAFSVQVQTGLLDAGASDDANLGVMMHELQHAVGLHLIHDVRTEKRVFYIAPDRLPEPIGRQQKSDSRAASAGIAWRAAAESVGPFDDIELGGLPLGGELTQIFDMVAASGFAQNQAACANAVQLIDGLRNDIRGSIDTLDTSLNIDLGAVPPRVSAALDALKNECLANFTKSFVEVVAAISGQTPEAIDAALSPHDRELVKGKHIVDAISALALDRRATMRAAEEQFTMQTGRPWTALRYFSIEEDADDVSVDVLRGAELDPAGQGMFLLTAIPNDRARCEQLIASGEVPPYGVDLSDEHHATCWRVHHIDQLASARMGATGARVAPQATGVTAPKRLPLPRRLRDRISH